MIFVGNPRDKNRVDESGVAISPGFETFLPLSFSSTNATQQVIDKLSWTERNCYTNHEVDLPILRHEMGYRYSMGNCMYEASMQRVITNCNCTPFFYAEPFNFKGITNIDLPICHGQGLICMAKQENYVEKNPSLLAYDLKRNRELVKIDCMSNCDHHVVTVSSSVRKYPNKLAFQQTKHICYAWKKILRICKNQIKKSLFLDFYKNDISCEEITNIENDKNLSCNFSIFLFEKYPKVANFLYKYAEENFAYVKIYSKYPYHSKHKMDLEMDEIQFISNLGGLLGLCLGLSIISLFEIAYHIVDGLLGYFFKH